MADSGNNRNILAVFYLVTATIAITFTVLIASSLTLILHHERRQAIAMAKGEALATFNKDQSFRLWATKHGGVYVPISEHTPPNPYLSHIPERDLTTPSGKRLTLMNPAYMMKQTMAEYYQQFGSKGHITSLMPLNPGNSPDPWERKALEAFRRGDKEAMEIHQSGGRLFLRFMKPMITQEGCLKCHEIQGYKKGDIRGGVGVSVPMDNYLAHEKSNKSILGFSYMLVWLLGMTGIGFGFVKGRSGILARSKADEDIRRLNTDLEQRVAERTAQLTAANSELESFAYSVSHDLRAPLRSIDGFSQALLDDCSAMLDEQGKDYLRRACSASMRMGRLIDDLLKLSRISRSEISYEINDLTAIARMIAGELQEAQPERRVEFVIQDGLTDRGDPRLLRIALENLLGNAWKFTENQPQSRIEFGASVTDGESIYFVRDNGAGFDMTYVDKLFIPFQRLHGTDEFAGTGIGLSIVKRIIQRHGGEIRAEGAVEKGATFYFTLQNHM
jgi:signal transduction histidine kinase